jgi:hypothetical protein
MITKNIFSIPKVKGRNRRNRLLRKLTEQLQQVEWGDMTWGSSQYGAAYETYQIMLKYFHAVGKKGIIHMFNIQNIPIESEFIQSLQTEWVEIYEQYADEKDEYAKQIGKEMSEKVINIIDNWFEYTKNLSWDLWSAIRCPISVPDDFMDNVKLPTRGPVYNMLAQGENFFVGVKAALLTYLYGVSEESFAGYDT